MVEGESECEGECKDEGERIMRVRAWLRMRA